MTPTAQTNPGGVAIGVLLAGGEARRMGRDKRLMLLDGSTLLQRNLVLLRDLFPAVAISVRDASQAPADLPSDVHVVPDVVPGSPLAGLASVLTRFRQPVFALAADIAFAERGAVARVIAAYHDVDVALPVAEDHLEPLHAVYGPGCLWHIERLLRRGAHSILDLLPEVRVATVEFDSVAPFFNVNTPEDWEKAQRRFAGRSAAAYREPAARDAAEARPDVLGIVGRSGSGKTTLIERLIPELARLGLRVGTVKRVARFEIDTPGKDSWRHATAGAEAYAVASSSKLAYVADTRAAISLDDIVARYFPGFDLVLCEGYSLEAGRTIEVFRREAGHAEPICAPDETLALVTDAGLPHEHRFAPDDIDPLLRFLGERLGLGGGDTGPRSAAAGVPVSPVRFADARFSRTISAMDEPANTREPAGQSMVPSRADAPPALVAIVGKSDSGKTTLIEKLVPELVKLGLRVGTIKHDAHSFEIDHPGKDSWRHGQAGAQAYVIASPARLAFITRLDGEVPLADIARRFFAGFDLVVAEGYKRTAPHRVEIFRTGAGHTEPLCGPGEALAVVTDAASLEHEHRFGLDDGVGLAAFLAARLDALKGY